MRLHNSFGPIMRQSGQAISTQNLGAQKMNAFVCSTLLYCLEPVANHHLTDTVAHWICPLFSEENQLFLSNQISLCFPLTVFRKGRDLHFGKILFLHSFLIYQKIKLTTLLQINFESAICFHFTYNVKTDPFKLMRN